MLNPKVPDAAVSEQSQAPKEMLTLTHNGKQTVVKINFSSLDLIQTCLRKAHYSLERKLREKQESTALAFGSAVHKALELWYQLPDKERVVPKSLEEQCEQYAFGNGLDEPSGNGAVEAIRQFCQVRHGVLSLLPPEDKRSLASGVRILKAYFRHYANDGFHVYRDGHGPVVERLASFTMHDSPDIRIDYFGTIDCVLQHKDSGVIVVADHKTTSALGKEFYQRVYPNFQYTGYVYLAQKSLGIDTKMFMVNGLQTAKTKTEFARQITERSEEDFEELKWAVQNAVARWINAKHTHYPMTTPNPCSMYSGCQYRKICEVPRDLRETVIKGEYT
jgi:hypothetical protein